MAEGVGNGAGPAVVDTQDVFNPKQLCRNCGAENDIAITLCIECGKDVYGTDKMTIEIEDTNVISTVNTDSEDNKKTLTKMLFEKKIAAPDPEASQTELIVVQNEGMMELAHLEDFMDDNVDEGRKDRNNQNDNNHGGQNLNAFLNGNLSSKNRPLFTTILVIYWLYYLVWFGIGIFLTIPSSTTQYLDNEIQAPISIVCLILPSLIMLVLMARISCLNSLNLNNLNHYENLNENAKQKYKLMSILITILLMFAALLRVIWWIYCMLSISVRDFSYNQQNENDSSNSNIISQNRFDIVLITLLINEFGTIFLINIDYLKMSYFEQANPLKQGIFGIVYNPYPCLISLTTLCTIQLWLLAYSALSYDTQTYDGNQTCQQMNFKSFFIGCGLHAVYLSSAIITILIPIIYTIKQFIKPKHDINPNGFDKLSKLQQHIVTLTIIILAILTIITGISIFGEFRGYTWMHLLLIPQFFGVMWALFKLNRLSQ